MGMSHAKPAKPAKGAKVVGAMLKVINASNGS